MDKKIEQLLFFVERKQDELTEILKDDTLSELDRANLEGRFDGLSIVHARLVGIYMS